MKYQGNQIIEVIKINKDKNINKDMDLKISKLFLLII